MAQLVGGDLFQIRFTAWHFLRHPVCLIGRDRIDSELRAPVQVQAYHEPARASRVISVATLSRKPRTALTGLPSGGAVIDEGTPKKERNHMLAPSSSNTGADIAYRPTVNRYEPVVIALSPAPRRAA